jgi:hypothetical protein
MFIVSYLWSDSRGDCGDAIAFDTERKAREWINARANGWQVYTLEGPDGEVIVESAWPVLLVE